MFVHEERENKKNARFANKTFFPATKNHSPPRINWSTPKGPGKHIQMTLYFNQQKLCLGNNQKSIKQLVSGTMSGTTVMNLSLVFCKTLNLYKSCTTVHKSSLLCRAS